MNDSVCILYFILVVVIARIVENKYKRQEIVNMAARHITTNIYRIFSRHRLC